MTIIFAAQVANKGQLLRRLDEHYQSVENCKATLDRIKQGDNIVQIGLDDKVLTRTDASRLAKYWFNDEPPGHWPHHQNKAEIVTAGIAKALDLAVKGNKPVETLHLANGDKFQAAVSESPQQVTLMLITPPPPIVPHNLALKEEEALWHVVSGDDLRQMNAPSGFSKPLANRFAAKPMPVKIPGVTLVKSQGD